MFVFFRCRPNGVSEASKAETFMEWEELDNALDGDSVVEKLRVALDAVYFALDILEPLATTDDMPQGES